MSAPARRIPSRAAFRTAFLEATQLPPARLRDDAPLSADWIDTPIGPLFAVADASAICLLEFPERRALPKEMMALLGATGHLALRPSPVIDQAAQGMAQYFSGTVLTLALPLHPKGTPFEHRHWQALREIPPGKTRSYGAMAEALGSSPRAIGRANGANPIAIAIPCHRLVASDGALTGYGGGLWRKRWLLDHEAKYTPLM